MSTTHTLDDSDGSLSRRQFLKWASGALLALGGVALAVPLIDSVVGPALRTVAETWSKVTGLDSLPANQPTNVRFADTANDAYLKSTQLHTAWAIKQSSGEVTLFSPLCPHLGCKYAWNDASGHFECPCHGSVFDRDGKVLGGPAPRPLDTLPTKIESGVLYARWERFKAGLPTKVKA